MINCTHHDLYFAASKWCVKILANWLNYYTQNYVVPTIHTNWQTNKLNYSRKCSILSLFEIWKNLRQRSEWSARMSFCVLLWLCHPLKHLTVNYKLISAHKRSTHTIRTTFVAQQFLNDTSIQTHWSWCAESMQLNRNCNAYQTHQQTLKRSTTAVQNW